MRERFTEAPEEDVLEQLTEITEVGQNGPRPGEGLPFEANEADVADQGAEVGIDEDEYR